MTSYPALAIDCGKSVTPVERAICEQKELIKQDNDLATAFVCLRSKLDTAGKLQIRQKQIEWVAKREAQCSYLPDEQLSNCISEMTNVRLAELKPADGCSAVTSQTPKSEISFMLGPNKIVIKLKEESETYYFEGEELFSDKGIEKFDEFQSRDVSAVLVGSADQWGGHCSQYYVIESRGVGQVKWFDFGRACIALDSDIILSKTKDGFESKTLATPNTDGTKAKWSAGSGYSDEPIEFAPKPGFHVADVIRFGESLQYEPTDIIEFFAALVALPKVDEERILKSTWQVLDGCETCGGELKRNLYGGVKDKNAILFSGCGFNIEAGSLNCGADDASGLLFGK